MEVSFLDRMVTVFLYANVHWGFQKELWVLVEGHGPRWLAHTMSQVGKDLRGHWTQ